MSTGLYGADSSNSFEYYALRANTTKQQESSNGTHQESSTADAKGQDELRTSNSQESKGPTGERDAPDVSATDSKPPAAQVVSGTEPGAGFLFRHTSPPKTFAELQEMQQSDIDELFSRLQAQFEENPGELVVMTDIPKQAMDSAMEMWRCSYVTSAKVMIIDGSLAIVELHLALHQIPLGLFSDTIRYRLRETGDARALVHDLGSTTTESKDSNNMEADRTFGKLPHRIGYPREFTFVIEVGLTQTLFESEPKRPSLLDKSELWFDKHEVSAVLAIKIYGYKYGDENNHGILVALIDKMEGVVQIAYHVEGRGEALTECKQGVKELHRFQKRRYPEKEHVAMKSFAEMKNMMRILLKYIVGFNGDRKSIDAEIRKYQIRDDMSELLRSQYLRALKVLGKLHNHFRPVVFDLNELRCVISFEFAQFRASKRRKENQTDIP